MFSGEEFLENVLSTWFLCLKRKEHGILFLRGGKLILFSVSHERKMFFLFIFSPNLIISTIFWFNVFRKVEIC